MHGRDEVGDSVGDRKKYVDGEVKNPAVIVLVYSRFVYNSHVYYIYF